eukprot:3013181-Rhodomonas_salina.1
MWDRGVVWGGWMGYQDGSQVVEDGASSDDAVARDQDVQKLRRRDEEMRRGRGDEEARRRDETRRRGDEEMGG